MEGERVSDNNNEEMAGKQQQHHAKHAEADAEFHKGEEISLNMPMMTVQASGGANDRKFLYIAACVANVASFICGTTFGWTSPEIPKLKAFDDNPIGELLTSSEEGWIGSLLPLAAAIGPFAGGYMVDRLGRKKTILAATLPFIAAFLLNVIASTVYHFYLSRFLCGFGVGIIFTVLPMYIGEIADNETRGSLGSLMQLFIVMGLSFSYGFGPFLSINSFNVLLIVPPVLFLIAFYLFIPDSPYFLIKCKEDDLAEASLIKLRGERDKGAVQNELKELKALVEEDQKDKKTFFDIFKEKALTKALFLSVSLVVCQQLSGINIVLFYTQDIFTSAGVSLSPAICTILMGLVQIAASGATPALVGKWGKRFLLMLSGIAMGMSQAILGYFFQLKERGDDVSSISWLPIVCLVVYIVAYCLGFGPLPWAVMGELFPGNIKSAASTVTASGCWVLGFLLTKYFNLVTAMIGTGPSFEIFAGCSFAAALFVFKFLPETTGRSLQEILNILGGHSK